MEDRIEAERRKTRNEDMKAVRGDTSGMRWSLRFHHSYSRIELEMRLNLY